MILNPNNEKSGHEFDIKDFEEVKWHKMAIETIKSFEIEKVQSFQKILLKFPSGLGENIDASEIIHTQEHFPIKLDTVPSIFRVAKLEYLGLPSCNANAVGENEKVGTS